MRPDLMRTVGVASVLLVAAALFPTLPAEAQQDPLPPPPATLTVLGSGEASAVPDTARLRAGVETRAATAGEALAANSVAMQAVIDALAAAGIEGADVATYGISLHPMIEHRTGPDNTDVQIESFIASNGVTVTIGDPDQVGAVIDTVVRAGANDLGGLSFEIADQTALEDRARRAAVEDARVAAETYAEAAGVRLGRILSISDRLTGDGPRPMTAGSPRAMAADAAPPVALGTRSVTAVANVVWEIAPSE